MITFVCNYVLRTYGTMGGRGEATGTSGTKSGGDPEVGFCLLLREGLKITVTVGFFLLST
jgi:hypothetical protein